MGVDKCGTAQAVSFVDTDCSVMVSRYQLFEDWVHVDQSVGVMTEDE